MTYRRGAFVVDTRENRLAQVIGGTDVRVQVQRPDGGLQWEVPASVLRLATRAEREAAGLHGTASPVQCAECAELRRAQRAAVDGGDRALAVAATVAVRRHVRDAHHFPKGAAW